MNTISIVKYVCEAVIGFQHGWKSKYTGLPSRVMIRMVKELRNEKQSLLNLFVKDIRMDNVGTELPKRLDSMFGGNAHLSKWDDIIFIFGMVSTLAEKYKDVDKYDVDLSDAIISYIERPKMQEWIKSNGDWYTFCLLNYTREDYDMDLMDMINYLGFCMILQIPIF